jgi:RNA polymerase sigma-70 factor, ECF subfamily
MADGQEGCRMEERKAVERLKRGDVGGLEVLVRRYHTRAVRAAYLVVHDRSLAEDLAQGAFVRAYEGIGRFDADRPFSLWLMKIVLNDAIKTSKKRERTVSLEVGGAEEALARLADPGTGPHEQAEAAEVRRRVWRALEELPPAQRAAVVQRHYLGMSEAEMAESGHSPPGTIKKRLHVARGRLSKLLRPRVRAEEAAPSSLEQSAQIRAPGRGSEREWAEEAAGESTARVR